MGFWFGKRPMEQKVPSALYELGARSGARMVPGLSKESPRVASVSADLPRARVRRVRAPHRLLPRGRSRLFCSFSWTLLRSRAAAGVLPSFASRPFRSCDRSDLISPAFLGFSEARAPPPLVPRTCRCRVVDVPSSRPLSHFEARRRCGLYAVQRLRRRKRLVRRYRNRAFYKVRRAPLRSLLLWMRVPPSSFSFLSFARARPPRGLWEALACFTLAFWCAWAPRCFWRMPPVFRGVHRSRGAHPPPISDRVRCRVQRFRRRFSRRPDNNIILSRESTLRKHEILLHPVFPSVTRHAEI